MTDWLLEKRQGEKKSLEMFQGFNATILQWINGAILRFYNAAILNLMVYSNCISKLFTD